MIISIWSHLLITLITNNTIIWIACRYRKVFIPAIVEGDCYLNKYLLAILIRWSNNPFNQAQRNYRDLEHKHPFRISLSIKFIRINKRKLIWIKQQQQQQQEEEDCRHYNNQVYYYHSSNSYSSHSYPNHSSYNNNNSHSRPLKNGLQHCKSKTAWLSQE